MVSGQTGHTGLIVLSHAALTPQRPGIEPAQNQNLARTGKNVKEMPARQLYAHGFFAQVTRLGL